METWFIVTIVAVAAIVMLAVGWIMAVKLRYTGLYTDAKIVEAINTAYTEAGKDPKELQIDKIVQIQSEDSAMKSIFDVKITFVGGENIGKTLDFRYYIEKVPSEADQPAQLVVTLVEAAPPNSPLKTN